MMFLKKKILFLTNIRIGFESYIITERDIFLHRAHEQCTDAS